MFSLIIKLSYKLQQKVYLSFDWIENEKGEKCSATSSDVVFMIQRVLLYLITQLVRKFNLSWNQVV